jgi:hypothetical protein
MMTQTALSPSLHKSPPKSNRSKPKKLPRILPSLNLTKKKTLQLLRNLKSKLRPSLLLLRSQFQWPKKLPSNNLHRRKVRKNPQKR